MLQTPYQNVGGVGSPGLVVEATEDGGSVASHDRGGRGEVGEEAGAVGAVAVGSGVSRATRLGSDSVCHLILLVTREPGLFGHSNNDLSM